MRIILLFCLIATSNLFANTITVTNTNDAGAGSLRQAVINAISGDTIDFDIMMISTGSDTIKLASEISYNKSLVINGIHTSYDTLFISGENSCRIFNITGGNSTLNRLTLVNGNSINGGAIYAGANLQLYDCNFLHNYTSGYGGALYKSGGNLVISNCQFFNNSALDYGGAIYLSPSGTNLFEYSTFYSNHSDTYGGGYYGFVANVDINGCTFNNNSAVSEGGAIYDWGSAVILNVTNSTFINNSASQAGGIDFWGSSIVFTMESSVVTGNLGAPNLDIWGAGAILNSNGYNVIGDMTYAGSLGTDQLNIALGALNFGPMQDNGEKTFTLMPSAGSVAEDNGNPLNVSDAQNGPVTDGSRDAGAAEYYNCPIVESSFFALECSSYTVPSGDETYAAMGLTIATDTIQTVCGADSVMTIYIYIDDSNAPVPDNATLADVSGECSVTPTAPTATDACSGVITGTPSVTFPITTLGTTIVTWTYNDGIGNISTQDQNILVTPLDLSITQNGFTLSANTSSTGFQWLDCTNGYAEVTGETNADFTATSNGSYAVEITNGSCSDTSACYLISGIGFEENNPIRFTIFPNPGNGLFTVQSSIQDAYISVYSIEGKIILSYTKLVSAQQAFDISEFEKGIYLVKIKTESEEEIVKLIVQ